MRGLHALIQKSRCTYARLCPSCIHAIKFTNNYAPSILHARLRKHRVGHHSHLETAVATAALRLHHYSRSISCDVIAFHPTNRWAHCPKGYESSFKCASDGDFTIETASKAVSTPNSPNSSDWPLPSPGGWTSKSHIRPWAGKPCN